MATKSVKDLANKTPRDEERRLHREALAMHWAVVDSHIEDALEGSLPATTRSSP